MAEMEIPNFESLNASGPMTARMAAGLWFVADSAFGEYFDGGADAWLIDLPPIAQGCIEGEFIEAFGERLGIVADRIAAGLRLLNPIATCTAYEVVLNLVVDRAAELREEGGLDYEWIEGLPSRVGDDDYDAVRDYLFDDFDVRLLFDPAFDGIEDPDDRVYQAEGFVNLHPRDWFKTFEK